MHAIAARTPRGGSNRVQGSVSATPEPSPNRRGVGRVLVAKLVLQVPLLRDDEHEVAQGDLREQEQQDPKTIQDQGHARECDDDAQVQRISRYREDAGVNKPGDRMSGLHRLAVTPKLTPGRNDETDPGDDECGSYRDEGDSQRALRHRKRQRPMHANAHHKWNPEDDF